MNSFKLEVIHYGPLCRHEIQKTAPNGPVFSYIEITGMALLNCGLLYIGRDGLATDMLFGPDPRR